MSGEPGISLKSKLLLVVVLVVSIFIPLQFWRSVWFGQQLSDAEIDAALSPSAAARSVQHALAAVEERIRKRDPQARAWYPRIASLAGHPRSEVRVLAAWVMGQDNQSPLFEQTLAGLLSDPDPMVQRNAALALTRFADPRTLPVLREMLRPYPIRAHRAGTVSELAGVGELVAPGNAVARVGEGDEAELASPLPGRIGGIEVRPGVRVEAGQLLLTLAPDPEHVWEALRALLLIGGEEERPLVEAVLSDPRYSSQVREQARLTLEAIESRNQ